MILHQNQSITALSSLLHLQPQAIVHDLLAVQSIVKIPGDDNEPVMLCHTTLWDFLMTKSCSGKFYVHPPFQNILLAIDCLQALANNTSEYFFEGNALVYACFEWPHHLEGREEMLTDTIIESLITLLRDYSHFNGRLGTILFWVHLLKKMRCIWGM